MMFHGKIWIERDEESKEQTEDDMKELTKMFFILFYYLHLRLILAI